MVIEYRGTSYSMIRTLKYFVSEELLFSLPKTKPLFEKIHFER